MRIKSLMAAAVLAALPAATAQAQYFNSMPVPNHDGTPFWDQVSNDGRNCNIGYVLTGTMSGCSVSNTQLLPGFAAAASANLPAWYAHGFNNVNQSVGFGFVAGSAGADLTYWGGIAGANPLKQMVVRNTVSNTILFTFNSANTSYHILGGILFDIGIYTDDPGTLTANYFSWSSVQPNNFAAFGNGTTFGNGAYCGTSCWVGGEDVHQTYSDYDYQDGILQISGASATVVPEPSSVLLMMSGLIGLGVVARRRKHNA